jgi:hypothetical protein
MNRDFMRLRTQNEDLRCQLRDAESRVLDDLVEKLRTLPRNYPDRPHLIRMIIDLGREIQAQARDPRLTGQEHAKRRPQLVLRHQQEIRRVGRPALGPTRSTDGGFSSTQCTFRLSLSTSLSLGRQAPLEIG